MAAGARHALLLLLLGLVALGCNAAPETRKLKAYRIWESMNDPPRVEIEISDAVPFQDIHEDLEEQFIALDAEAEYPDDPEKFYLSAIRTRPGLKITQTGDLPEKVFVLFGQESYFFPSDNIGEKFYVPLANEERELEIEVLSATPRLLLIKNFLSDEEADAIRAEAEPAMKRSTTTVPGQQQGKGVLEQVMADRTSSTAWLKDRPVVNMVGKRVEQVSTISIRWAESLQVLRYQKDQHYLVHHDFFDPLAYPGDSRWSSGHNRILTFFFYLTDVEEGGETMFPYGNKPRSEWHTLSNSGNCPDFPDALKIPPKKGNAIMFYSVPARNQTEEHIKLDISSLHGGCDPIIGEKWAANYWVRNGIAQLSSTNVPPPKRISTMRKNAGRAIYGVDESWPIQHAEVKEGALGKAAREGRYKAFMDKCSAAFSAEECDKSEQDRIYKNFHAPVSVGRNFTAFGGYETSVEPRVGDKIDKFWTRNMKKILETPGTVGTPLPASFVNTWDAAVKTFELNDDTFVGGSRLATILKSKVQGMVTWWTGYDVRVSREPVLVLHHRGAIVAPHIAGGGVDKIGAVVFISDGEKKGGKDVTSYVPPFWPIELYGHDGVAVNHTLSHENVLLWEAQSVVFGRPFVNARRYFAAVYLFFEPENKAVIRDPDGDDDIMPKGADGATKMHNAANAGKAYQIQALLDDGRNKGQAWHMATDVNGWGAIHEAARGGHLEAVQVLVEHGVDFNVRTNGGVGWTPLALAVENHGENHPVVQYFREIGALQKTSGEL